MNLPRPKVAASVWSPLCIRAGRACSSPLQHPHLTNAEADPEGRDYQCSPASQGQSECEPGLPHSSPLILVGCPTIQVSVVGLREALAWPAAGAEAAMPRACPGLPRLFHEQGFLQALN